MSFRAESTFRSDPANLYAYSVRMVLAKPHCCGRSQGCRARFRAQFSCERNVHTLPKLELARLLSVVLTERITVGMLTSYEVVALGRSPYTGWSGTLRHEDHAIVEESIRAVEAGHLANRYAH